MVITTNYRVDRFGDRYNNWNRTNDGTYTGNNEVRSFLEVINRPSAYMHTVVREADGQIFSIGTIVYDSNGRSLGAIRTIKPTGNTVQIDIGTGQNPSFTTILNAAPVAPARQTVQPIQTVNNTHRTVAQPAPTPTATTGNNATINGMQAAIIAAYPRTIRLERLNRDRGRQTLQQFLIMFFEEYNREKATIYVDTADTNREVQTPINRRRSLGDIFMICRYYYPTCTLREVLSLLYTTLPNHFARGFRTSYCHTILKRVWYYNAELDNTVADRTRNDEYSHPYRWYEEQLNLR